MVGTRTDAAVWEVMDTVKVALLSVVGSYAYGTPRPDSDIDYRGFFVADTEDFWSVRGKPPDTVDRKHPDITVYEVEKFMKLASAANPNVLEVLWAPSIFETDVGSLLVEHRRAFLSTQVETTYGGYAVSQLIHARKGTGGSRGQGHFKREKFLLHLFRLLEQGTKLLNDPDEFELRVEDPERLRELAALPLEQVEQEFVVRRDLMRQAAEKTALPDRPDWETINSLLVDIRRGALSLWGP